MNRAVRVGGIVVAAALALLAALRPVAACPRPYESPERMVARAPIVAEIEVLSVETGLAERFAAAVPDNELPGRRLPLDRLDLPEGSAEDLASVRALLLLAQVEDDGLVRGGNPRAPIPEILAPWLTRHGGEAAIGWTGVRFLMSLRHPAAIPALTRTLRERSEGCQLDDYLRWFLEFGDLSHAAAVVDRAEWIAATERERPGVRRLGAWRRDLLAVARAAGGKAAPLLPRLEALCTPR